ncbi:MAG: 4Fe-4S dicluster domain-containing protein [Planctomycetes bacterium]|nr:4Fe-4S dicluster domain-containing protein [Planctomycetota bacterium]
MKPNRREFIKKGALAAGSLAAGVAASRGLRDALAESAAQDDSKVPLTPVLTPDGKLVHVDVSKAMACPAPPSDAAVRTGVPGRKWVMVVDLSRCDGCKKCTEACSKMHFVPPPREWIKVFQMQDSPDTAPYWFPKPCFQCDNPPCTKVCPVDATFKRHDGIVLIDNRRCIGCRFCMAACPYSARFFNWGRPEEPPEASAHPYSPECGFPRRMGTVEKCDFCPNLAAQGILPACVSVCPMAAIYFGDQNEDAVTNSKGETERLSTLLRDRAAYRYLEELGTQPRVYYLPPKSRIFPAPGEEGNAEHEHEGTSR